MARLVRFLLLAMAVVLSAGLASARVPPREAGRVETPLLQGWRFHDGAEPIAAAAKAFRDDDWERVSLPHSWNALGEYGLQRTANTRNRQGEGWYRLVLDGRTLPHRARHYLQFDGVGNVADVWVNGAHVGRHAGAFSRFRLDVTDALRLDGGNVIAIRADNSKPAPGSPTQDVIPLQGDFFIHGGLYRPVSLISVDDAHIDLLDHGGPGVYLRTASLSDREAVIAVTTRLRRGGRTALELRTTLADAKGSIVAQTLTPAIADLAEQKLTIMGPHRWNGRRGPYQYSALVELLDHGRAIDAVRQKFGIRSIRIDPDRGFFLNGEHLALHGVSRHQDYLGRGWALEHADHARDMAMIEELGANTIRMAHYQHAEDWFDLSDSAGMIVWAEAPFVNKVSFSDAPASNALIANAREQLIELIRQNYNHPSVVTWSIGNETDIDVAFGRLGSKADPRPLLDELHRVARAEDPDRPTVIADCCESTPSVKIPELAVLAGHSELMGYNRYFGWYYGKTVDLGPHLDMLHARHPTIPISVSEYGAGAALSQHSDNPEGGPITAGGRPHPEEFQSWFHEQSWPQLRARPFIWASWIWNMFDFSSTVRNEGDAIDINDKGLVTFDRTTRKDAFYYYQSQWRDDVPVLHVTGRRYVDRAYPVTDVRVYSNLNEVRLVLNGAPAGTTSCADHVCIFRKVRLRPGPNHVEILGERGGKTVRDTADWKAPDDRDGVTIKVGDLVGFRMADGRRVGSDNWFVGGTPRAISAQMAQAIGGSGDSRFRSAMRTGAFRYAIPVPPGRWRVTLLFVGLGGKPSSPFEVTAENSTVLKVGPLASNLAVEKSFDVTVRDSVLDLGFGPDATVSAIDIRPLLLRAKQTSDRKGR